MTFFGDIQKQVEMLQNAIENEVDSRGKNAELADQSLDALEDVNSTEDNIQEEGFSLEGKSMEDIFVESSFEDHFSNGEIKGVDLEPQTLEQNDFLADFDAKKAVIYAEIINPKYF